MNWVHARQQSYPISMGALPNQDGAGAIRGKPRHEWQTEAIADSFEIVLLIKIRHSGARKFNTRKSTIIV
jgi:hypothetical protein